MVRWTAQIRRNERWCTTPSTVALLAGSASIMHLPDEVLDSAASQRARIICRAQKRMARMLQVSGKAGPFRR